MDAINALGRKLNLDRRDSRREPRVGKEAQYTGRARRKIIDRRESPGDRRERGGLDQTLLNFDEDGNI